MGPRRSILPSTPWLQLKPWSVGRAKGSNGTPKGGNKPQSEHMGAEDSLLALAVADAVTTMSHLETQWDAAKLMVKLREYFNKGAKGMSFKGKMGRTALEELVNAYADASLGYLYGALGDREWLLTGQVDFLLLLDAGIKDHFPQPLLESVAQSDFENLVLQSYERAFDEQRFFPILTEAVPAVVSGPKLKKKVWNALDQGRKDTMKNLPGSADEMVNNWIQNSVKLLSEASGGYPEGLVEAPSLVSLFCTLIAKGSLPRTLLQEGQPIPVGMVDGAVNAAYIVHTQGADEEPVAKKLHLSVSMGLQGYAVPAWGGAAGGGLGASMFGLGSPWGLKLPNREPEPALEQGPQMQLQMGMSWM